MTTRTPPPLRVDHVGRLLRPSELLRARSQHELRIRGVPEDEDTLKRRIDDAARHVPLDRLCRSAQCELSSTVEGTNLTLAEQTAGLRPVVETAAEVWG